ncbi:MAG: hypothetical protein J1F42_01595 [Lachnospiraceae bacterium]|nr:hypothetical protein [Lachnospiraceae bacterium]
MGTQSARLYYQGKDHKDIFYRGNFHNKMYKGNQLLWEKLYPDECLLDWGNTGIYIYDIEHKCVDVMPFSYKTPNVGGTTASMNKDKWVACYLETIGSALHAHVLREYDWVEAHSMDGKLWKKDSEQHNLVSIYSTYTDNSRLFQIYNAENVILRLSEDKRDIIYNSDEKWNRIKYVRGKGKNYKFYNGQKNLITVDESGNIMDEVNIDNLSYGYMTLWRAGNSIYAKDSSYTYLYKLDESTNTMVAVSTNFFNSRTSPYVIYSDDEETIVSIAGDNYVNTWIASFKSGEYAIKNALQNGCVSVKSEDGENINVYVNTKYNDYTYPYMTVIKRRYAGSGTSDIGIYMSNYKSSINKDKGFFIYGSVHEESGACVACVYFDNPYFLESEGNRVYKLPNYN